jgi:lipopolysaccharide export system ATP-binding protein
MPTLQGVDLSKSYRGRKVVDNIELEIGRGEVVGLLGPNGAGKTTTFYMIVGLARPDSGRVLLNNSEITDLPMYLRARNGISYLPQEPSVFRQLTSEENLLAVLETLPLTPAWANGLRSRQMKTGGRFQLARSSTRFLHLYSTTRSSPAWSLL